MTLRQLLMTSECCRQIVLYDKVSKFGKKHEIHSSCVDFRFDDYNNEIVFTRNEGFEYNILDCMVKSWYTSNGDIIHVCIDNSTE